MRQCIKLATAAIGALGAAALILSATAAAAGVTRSGPFYQVEVITKSAGDEVVATVRTTGKGGYGCNTLYPWKLTMTPGPGVEMTKTSFGKADATTFTKEEVVFEVRYKARAGAGEIKAKLKLSGCDDKQCQMEQVDLAWPAR